MTGKLYGLGLGPGDPELMTLKAHRILTSAPVVAYPAPDTGASFARQIAAPYLRADQLEVPMIVPMRVERYPAQEIYDAAAVTLSHHLDAGSDVAVLCEGDPFFYGSFMYLFERLAHRYPTEVVPGVSSMMAAAAAYGRPLAARNDVLTVLPGPLENDVLRARIESASAVAIIKLGRHFPRIRALIDAMGLTANAGYVERVSLHSERLLPLGDVAEDVAPYFSMILIYKGAEGWALGAAPQTERL
ncbi:MULTISPECIES: precorrin-2 C(20)-methyltransferase [Rhizobium/Agrobacterium group]|uniref:Precorrin-2 C20-methyltransferase n=2 Tax=Rhizobium/Agrobacterium group TaxID=227290 RepID=B9JXB4_ALLAM|nr:MULTISPECIES: precorrin-2 C(20)-methyltransferase [Rhizobium/Agrobacterium group]ACM36892.1 precorrin-2 C20-methyltransferase [Allorhizobium ampelinum S4]MUO31158.1 precorrin-2 C(20)-methyltransferase [Agrobacterium vitis]MUO44767.1 precorrin-2 C(20)-methyltransferase [Agrobacterium vitis]MUP12864.1 precorrin-2 C(20)-methyltransferase [Agrobacterium vitis]